MRSPVHDRRQLAGWVLAAAAAIVVGCQSAAVVESEWKLPNPWGTPFADREDVLKQIPIGSALGKIRPVMQAHGYEERSRVQHDRAMKIVFIPTDLTRLRKSFPKLEITIQLQNEIVVAVDAQPLPADSAAGPGD